MQYAIQCGYYCCYALLLLLLLQYSLLCGIHTMSVPCAIRIWSMPAYACIHIPINTHIHTRTHQHMHTHTCSYTHIREFTNRGLVKGSLAIYVSPLYNCNTSGPVFNVQLAKPPFTKPPFVNSRHMSHTHAHIFPQRSVLNHWTIGATDKGFLDWKCFGCT